jgi:tetratricopeptide (TPR) repeat protein
VESELNTCNRMFKRSRLFTIVLAFASVPGSVHAQAPPKPDNKPDYSKEAFVVENTSTRIVFENDGTSTRESSARVRIQSDAGIQRYGLLTFSYENSTESVDVDYVRVLKPDGTTIPTPAGNTQDMAAQITREAPFYSDLRERHVAVKGLSVGDVLEFHVQWHAGTPLIPGQFWYAYNFSHDGIILQEQLRISVPWDRPVKWKSPDVKPGIAEEAARRVFTWTSSQLEHKSSEQDKADQEQKLYQAARGQLPPADVQISTFQSWEEVGRWYGNLQQERVKPTPEILAKAAELTKGASDDDAKLRAIYKYVSADFRYIGIAFGIGRYQPHTAAEVLGNQYGDCKDKHTLLASLLDAAGIKAYPALISTLHDIDPDVPSPGQFDHVIGVVPQGDRSLWLDTTPEVAPFAYLLSPLRGKHALVIPGGKPPMLMATPTDPPSKAAQTFKIEAKLDDSGTLAGKIERTVQGDDGEVLLRSAFRRVPMPQWKDLIQQISYGSGFAGDVSEVTASSPEKTDEPFHFTYSYKRKDYPDWTERRINSPLPPMIGVTPDSKPSHPIFLGETGEFQYESRVELPKGYWPAVPDKVDLKEDYAEYHASYSGKDGVLTTERRFVVKLRDVPASEYDAFKKFAKAVADDHEVYAALNSGSPPANSSPTHSYQDEIWKLPYSENPEAARAYDQAKDEYDKHDTQAEIASLKRAVEIDPKFTRAWLWLGEIYKFTRQSDLAVQAYRKAVDIDQQPVSYKALGFALMGMGKFEDAIPVWQALVKISPDDPAALSALSGAFFAAKHYSESAATMESAIKLTPDHPGPYVQLGSAYLRAGNDDKALAAFKKAVEIDQQPLWLNNIAYALATADKQLPLALQYAEKAVHEEEAMTAKVKLSDLKKEDLGYTLSVAAYWDTLGWVHFRLENYDKAEKYLHAAWTVTQGSTEADHLGQIYEKQGKTKAAIHMYQLALAGSPATLGNSNLPETRARLEHLRPGGSESSLVFSATPELSTIRTFKLPRLAKETANAEFFVLVGTGSKEAKFISGSDQLKSADKSLDAIDFRTSFPDDGPTRLLRRGILSCFPTSGCAFVLSSPYDVHSVN